MLESGVAARKAFNVVAKRTHDRRARIALDNIDEAVQEGHEVAASMAEQGNAFPPLMIDMVAVGEKTGALPEILKSLALHYENLVRLRRSFMQAIAWPMFQLNAAIWVIALLVMVLGMIAQSTGSKPLPVLPFGLSGGVGAIIWLMTCYGTLAAIIGGYLLITKTIQGRKLLDPLLMKIPVVGGCMQSFAIARFSWAFSLTQNSGMEIRESLEASLNATSNGAYISAIPQIWADVSSGDPLASAMRRSGLFPGEYMEMVETAEESGTVPEMLDHLGPQFEEDARRALKAMTSTLAWAIWAMVAVFIIVLIFRVASIYLGMINQAANF